MVRSCQASISIDSCTELSKAQFFLVSIVNQINSKHENNSQSKKSNDLLFYFLLLYHYTYLQTYKCDSTCMYINMIAHKYDSTYKYDSIRIYRHEI